MILRRRPFATHSSAPFRWLPVSAALLGFLGLFAATAPWQVGVTDVSRFSAAMGIALLIVALILILFPSARKAAARQFLWEDQYYPPWVVALGGAAVAVFLYLILKNRYEGFEVNAWDFSFYDRPLARPFDNGFLFNPIENRSVLATHTYFLLLPFLPLYALHPSPYWLLAGQALALAAASVACFYCVRRICGDDLGAGLLAAAFLFNPYTARAAQYAVHPEIFYPVCLFLLAYGFLLRRPVLFGVALLGTVLVKEDAFLPLLGFALTAAVYYKRYRWAVLAAATGIVLFLVSYYWILPYFAGRSGPPWYSHYWAKYGSSPPAAAVGMALHPLEIGRDVLVSGFLRLMGTLALAPLAGLEWLLAAAPAAVIYSAAAEEQLRHLRLYYSLPVLPFALLAAASGLQRLTIRHRASLVERRARFRVLALALLLLGAFLGPGYRLVDRQPSDAPARLARLAADRPLLVQGALLPHVGYLRNYAALKPPAEIDGMHGFLIMPTAVPFPFTKIELQRLSEELSQDQRFQIVNDRGVLLAKPVSWTVHSR
jgi:uncharacterized membrane protein